MDAKTKVALVGPAKIGGAWHKPGDEVDVDAETLDQLIAAKAIDESAILIEGAETPALAPDVMSFTRDEFEQAVAATAKVFAEAMIGEALKPLEAAHNDVLARAMAAEKDREELKAVVVKLTAQVADLDKALAAAAATGAKSAEAPAVKKTRGG